MTDLDRLYALLPGIYRQRDDQGQLRALMAVLTKVLIDLETEIAAVHDDSFIETCALTMIARLGARVGVEGLDDLCPEPHTRALVANAVRWRRRKGVATVLQPLIWETTGWWSRVTDLSEAGAPRVQAEIWTRQPLAFAGAAPHPLGDGPAPQLWTFDPEGAGRALVNLPFASPPADRPAPDEALPMPLTLAALADDLAAWMRRFGGQDPGLRPRNSVLYGPDRGLAVYVDGICVTPDRIVARDLTTALAPAGAYRGVYTAPMPSRAKLRAGARLTLRLAQGRQQEIILDQGGVMTPRQAATRLQAAIRTASKAAEVDAVRVVAVGRRLLVIAGPGAGAAFGLAADDAATAAALGLGATTAVVVRRSASIDPSRLDDLAKIVAPSLMVSLGGNRLTIPGPAPARSPGGLARGLQKAIRAAGSGQPPGWRDAVVLTDEDALILIPGPSAGPIEQVPSIAAGELGSWPVDRLGLAANVTIDPVHGLLASTEIVSDARLSVDFGTDGLNQGRDTSLPRQRLDALFAAFLPPDAEVQIVWR